MFLIFLPFSGVVSRSLDYRVAGRCDLRGQRVDEALDRLAASLDLAVADGRDGLLVIHGHGTGALRQAVRAHLRSSDLVVRVRAGGDDEGGEGVTFAEVR